LDEQGVDASIRMEDFIGGLIEEGLGQDGIAIKIVYHD
jgi:hypothetical protein